MSALDNSLRNLRLYTESPRSYHVEGGELQPISSRKRRGSESLDPDFLNGQIRSINSCTLDDLCDDRRELQTLFFDTLARQKYDRGLISCGGSLEQTLDPSVVKAYSNPDDSVDPVSDRKIGATVAETLFSLKLGVPPRDLNRPYHQVYYFSDRQSDTLGLFKAVDSCHSLRDTYGAAEKREAHLAEIASFELSSSLDMNLVPYTAPFTWDRSLLGEPPINGSFQLYVRDALELRHLVGDKGIWDPDYQSAATVLDTEDVKSLKLENFEALAFFDLLTGESDRNFTNILAKEGSAGDYHLVAIDNTRSFPWCHQADLPFYKQTPLHTFRWSTLPHANQPFSAASVEKINKIDLFQVEGLLRQALIDPATPSSAYHVDGKIRTLTEHFETIRDLGNKRASIRDIAHAVLELNHKGTLFKISHTVKALFNFN